METQVRYETPVLIAAEDLAATAECGVCITGGGAQN